VSAIVEIHILFGTTTVPAGEWHTGSSLVCSECHVLHYAGGEGVEPGGPFGHLLSHSTVNGLCLSCHDGRDPAAPDVLASVTMYQAGGDEFSAAGFFAGTDASSDKAHDLGVTDLVPLRTPAASMILSCASCHDVHGDGNYRNLISDPDSSGSGTTMILGIDVFEGDHPTVPPTPEGTATAYTSSNVGYRSGLSRWCAECHNSLEMNENGASPAHFKRHPSDVGLDQAGGHADPYHWVTGEGLGFGGTTGDDLEGVPRVRFQESAASDFTSAKAVAASNQVFCGSCHLAHGGTYAAGAVWPYKEPGADMYSPCQQCHNQ
jgi:hypothetical protein